MKVSLFQQGFVRGFIHEPIERATAGLVLTHGAGSNCEALLLIEVAKTFCEAGFMVLRCDLPFRQKRPFGPPMPANAAEDRAGLREAVNVIRGRGIGTVVLGGHSYGGRQATLLAADEPQIADALFLLSYPLHPPARPNQLRTSHWPRLQTSSFFVHGTKDSFGTIDELQSALCLVQAPVKLVTIEGAGHDLARGKFEIKSLVVAPFFAFASLPAA